MTATDREYYDQAWDSFVRDHPEDQARIDQTVGLVPAGASSLLDVGSGDGLLVRGVRARRPGVSTVAFDLSAVAVRRGGDGAVGSCDVLPFRSASVDVVTACEVLEHLPPAVYRRTLDEIDRVARRWVVVTVPNREDRRRSRVRCRACGCVYDRYRHLRSFDDDALRGLLPSFSATAVVELGPRALAYPWFVAQLAERAGVIGRAGAPVCPQCATPGPSDAARPPGGGRGEGEGEGEGEGGTGGARANVSALVKRALPRSRHRAWLAAVYERA